MANLSLLSKVGRQSAFNLRSWNAVSRRTFTILGTHFTGSRQGRVSKDPGIRTNRQFLWQSRCFSSSDDPVVLVTGASGFIGSYVVRKLQRDGYKVRASVRDANDSQKTDFLRNLCPNAKHPLEFVSADLLKPETWPNALKGCTYVMHLASPFPPEEPKDAENTLIKPAVDGTLSVLNAAQDAGVKRVVLTSSIAAVIGGMTDPDRDGAAFSEEHWPLDVNKLPGYIRSKTLAEQAAWDLYNSLPVDNRFELVVMNPSYTVGPAVNGMFASSHAIASKILNMQMPALPRLYFHMVDVRDVAEAHVKGMIVPEAAGHRHLLNGGAFWLRDLAKMTAEEFKPQGYTVFTMHCPYWMAWLSSFLDGTTAMLLPTIGCTSTCITDRMHNVLGIKQPRSVIDAFKASCYSMIELGYVKKGKRYKGPPSGIME